MSKQHIRLFRVAVLIMVCMVAGVGSALAQSVTIDEGDTHTTRILSEETDDVIINNGTIMTSESSGISSSGDDATITNSGVISTTMDNSSGIYSRGDGATITNDGTITAGGVHSEGIYSGESLNAVITNSGTIMATGEAISAHGDGAVITNSGSISTTGLKAHGIFMGVDPGNTAGGGLGGNGATISSSGSISTTGDNSDGIFVSGDNAMVTISGSISTTGAGAHGIFAGSVDATITISGSVSATGEDSYAVLGSDDGDQTLTLSPGARIIGRVDLGESEGDKDIVNIITNAAALSRTYTIEGADTFNLGELAVRNDNTTVAVIDPTGSSAERMALGSAAGQIRQLVFQRLAGTRQSVGVMGGDAGGTTRGAGGWGTFFGGGHERDDDGLVLAWSSNRFGAVGGYDIRMDSRHRVGLFAGGSRGHIETDVRSIKTDTNSGFIGAYGSRILGGGGVRP